jgi:hypothetical protein
LHRAQAPAIVTAGRVMVIVESSLWLLLGLILTVSGIGLIVAAGSIAVPRFPGLSVAGSAIGGAVLVAAAVVLGLAGAGIWSGIAMGRLSRGARVTALVLASLGVIAALLMLSSGLQPAQTITQPDESVTTLSATPTLVLGIVDLLFNAAIIWSAGFAAATRNAFRGTAGGLPPAALPFAGGAYPGWSPAPPPAAPGWGAPLPPADAPASPAPPPPPPPPA